MRLWADLRRLGTIAAVLARHGSARAVAPLARRFPRLGRTFPLAALPAPERFRRLLEELGGTFIKLGQMLALQPDIVSLATCNALFKLLDQVEPFAYADVERTFVEELGRGPGEIFDRFEREPLAAASIGQVHVAYRGGKTLAVKVRRPTVEKDFAGDIRLMQGLLRLIRRLRLRGLYWLSEPLSEFIAWTREELDYRYEARYMEQLGRNARGRSEEQVPAVYRDATTSRILTQDYFDGVTVLDYLRAVDAGDEVTRRRLAAQGFEPTAFARNLIDNFLGDAFRHGLFHADLHPANLMILPANAVGYLDFGITGVLSHYSRRHLIAMTLAYTRGDLDGMCKAFFKVSTRGAQGDPGAFRAGIRRLAASWYEPGEAADGQSEPRLRKNFTLVMLDMLRLSRASDIWPERDVIKYIRSAIAIDGLITRFAPGFDVGRYLAQVCDRHLRMEAMAASFSPAHLQAGLASGARLLRHGPARAGRFLDRVLAGALPLKTEMAAGRTRRGGRLAVLAVEQGGVAFTFAVLAALSSRVGGAELGLNPFTAALLPAGAGLLMAARTLWRLGRSSATKGESHA